MLMYTDSDANLLRHVVCFSLPGNVHLFPEFPVKRRGADKHPIIQWQGKGIRKDRTQCDSVHSAAEIGLHKVQFTNNRYFVRLNFKGMI